MKILKTCVWKKNLKNHLLELHTSKLQYTMDLCTIAQNILLKIIQLTDKNSTTFDFFTNNNKRMIVLISYGDKILLSLYEINNIEHIHKFINKLIEFDKIIKNIKNHMHQLINEFIEIKRFFEKTIKNIKNHMCQLINEFIEMESYFDKIIKNIKNYICQLNSND